jgi:hypothetical protein
MSLEAAAESARGGFACMFSTSDEYETALITQRRAQGRYDQRRSRWPAAIFVGCALVVAGMGFAAELAPSGSIREREGLAPAVFADLAVDHLAVFRLLEQCAHGTAIDSVWRVLIFSLPPGHFFRCLGLRNPRQESCRKPAGEHA